MSRDEQLLIEPWLMEFDYTRTTGPVVGRFLTGLRDRRLEGLRSADGTVLVPPTGYDPVTAASVDDWVEVGDHGVVVTWSWVPEPLPTHPLTAPFAWALVRLDGASTSLLHVVAAPSAASMSVGMRVVVRWAQQTRGHITDIACFEPVAAP